MSIRNPSLVTKRPTTPDTRLKTASPASVRDVNRSIVLALIRAHQPIARVALSEITGIFRGNVSEIVDELVGQGLVREERAVPAGRGRVPIHLSLNDDALLVLGVSVRPAETTLALAGLSGRLRATASFPTLPDPKAETAQIRALLRRLKVAAGVAADTVIRECGVSVPGHVRSEQGVVSWTPSLPQYAGFPLGPELQRKVGTVVSCENDCNLGAFAEMWLREGDIASVDDFVFLEVGDVGVGGGVIIDRQLYKGHDSSFIAEFGHMSIDPNGPECACGRKGCWELFVCDQATWMRYDARTRFSAPRFRKMLAEPARARQALIETGHYLALGLANIALAFNPKMIVLAGEITRAWDSIRPAIAAADGSRNLHLDVRPARLSAEELFLHGSVHLALSRVFAKPKLGW